MLADERAGGDAVVANPGQCAVGAGARAPPSDASPAGSRGRVGLGAGQHELDRRARAPAPPWPRGSGSGQPQPLPPKPPPMNSLRTRMVAGSSCSAWARQRAGIHHRLGWRRARAAARPARWPRSRPAPSRYGAGRRCDKYASTLTSACDQAAATSPLVRLSGMPKNPAPLPPDPRPARKSVSNGSSR